MIDTIVHYSDLHLKLYKNHQRDKGILENALKEWKKINPDRIVFTGDLVHSKNQMTPELIRLLSWWLVETAKICKCIYLIGNHDFLENNLDRLDALTPIIENINNENIIYYSKKNTHIDENINWCIYSLMDENERPEIEKIPGKTNIGLYHGVIKGLSTDVGFTFEEGADEKTFEGCDLVLAGDIHKRQIIDIGDNRKAYMIGSTICQNFGENISNHGYGVYNLTKNEYNTYELDNPQPYLNFKITDIEDIENETERLINR
jgi:DNA repair exonuclease SbcCD nuclease subunit|tara:strand:- start:11956 stop:12738 length:783 start_codon:yes stop_codon:yes gene_type:complete